MKAIILERRGDEAAVLCEDGTFLNRRVSGEVGETVELSAEVTAFPKKKRWMRTAVAAALALSVTGGTLGYMGGTASAYVSLDVEDSAIELAVNHFGRVIAVNAVSEDAESLARSLSAEIRHKPVRDALDHTMTRLRDEGYLAGAEQTVVAGVASDNTRRKAELAQTVTDAVDTQLLAVTESSRAEREQAHEQHMSVGKFGAKRDRIELSPAPDAAAEQDAEPPAEPAAPAIGTEDGITEEAPGAEPPQAEPRQPEWRESDGQSDMPAAPRQESPAQGGEQPTMQEQGPRGEHPGQRSDMPASQPENTLQGDENPQPQPEQSPQEQPQQEPQETKQPGQQDTRPQESEQHPQQETPPQDTQPRQPEGDAETPQEAPSPAEGGRNGAGGPMMFGESRDWDAHGLGGFGGDMGGPGGHGPV